MIKELYGYVEVHSFRAIQLIAAERVKEADSNIIIT